MITLMYEINLHTASVTHVILALLMHLNNMAPPFVVVCKGLATKLKNNLCSNL